MARVGTATPVGVQMWWSDTEQHSLSFEAWITRRTRDGHSLQDIADELADRTGGRYVVSKTTIKRWLDKIDKERG